MDLWLDLRDVPGRSLRARCEYALRAAIRSGRLPAGARLPPTRTLATQLGVSRGVVVETYAQLAAEGYLLTRRGGGTFVGRVPVTLPEPAADRPAPRRPPLFDLRPALPALDGAFRPAWSRAIARALRTTADGRLGYPDPLGEPELRHAVAESLARRRGVQAQPAQVLITGGLGPSLPFLWRLLAARGVRRVAIEKPCWPRLPSTLARAGLEPVPLAVDHHGADTSSLERLDAEAVFVTPAHQYPTGAVLSPERRAVLIDWARDRDGIVIEDDYDAEFRYDRHPVGSLQGLAPDVVIYGGSTSKTLAPGLRLGWLVLPADLVATAHADHGPPPVLDQLALAGLLTRGDFDRHLRHRRRLYRSRREALLTAVAERLPGLEVTGAAAGLHAVLHLPEGTDEAVVVETARARGIELDALGATGPALVVGYANLPETAAAAAVDALATAIASTQRDGAHVQ